MKGRTTLSIECGKEKKELTIRNNCNAERVAYDFCKKNDLDFASMKMLINKIKQVQAKKAIKEKKIINTSANTKTSNEEQKKMKRASTNKGNYGEQLYQKGISFQAKTTEKINKNKKEIQCSFRPHINPISFSVLYKRMTSHTECNNEDKIKNYQVIKNKELNELKSKHKCNRSEEKYSFRPKINKNSSQIDKELQFKSTVSSARYDKLYNDRKRIKINISKLTNKVYDKKVLFKPKINTNIISTVSSMNFTQRQKYYQTKSKEKFKHLTEETKNNFQPEINQKNNSRCYTDVFNDLYNKAEIYKQKRLNTMREIHSSLSSAIKANNTSNYIIEKKKFQCFTQLFHLMDKNKSGLITKDNIDTKNIPSHILTIFNTVIKELQEEDQTLNENEFVSVCYQLYEYLTYPEKKQFLDLRMNQAI